jgi:hypothetical protein
MNERIKYIFVMILQISFLISVYIAPYDDLISNNKTIAIWQICFSVLLLQSVLNIIFTYIKPQSLDY